MYIYSKHMHIKFSELQTGNIHIWTIFTMYTGSFSFNFYQKFLEKASGFFVCLFRFCSRFCVCLFLLRKHSTIT